MEGETPVEPEVAGSEAKESEVAGSEAKGSEVAGSEAKGSEATGGEEEKKGERAKREKGTKEAGEGVAVKKRIKNPTRESRSSTEPRSDLTSPRFWSGLLQTHRRMMQDDRRKRFEQFQIV